MRGQVRSAVHRREVPNRAPAIEYVAMPDGSSSAAPVTTPGPRMEKKRRMAPRGFALATLLLFWLKTTPRPGPPSSFRGLSLSETNDWTHPRGKQDQSSVGARPPGLGVPRHPPWVRYWGQVFIIHYGGDRARVATSGRGANPGGQSARAADSEKKRLERETGVEPATSTLARRGSASGRYATLADEPDRAHHRASRSVRERPLKPH